MPYIKYGDLLNKFEKYGIVLVISVKKGFAFLEYFNETSTKEAIRYMHGERVFGKDHPPIVVTACKDKAKPKPDDICHFCR